MKGSECVDTPCAREKLGLEGALADSFKDKNNQPQHRSLRMGRGGMSTKKSPGDMKESVAMSIINKVDKRPNYPTSEKQVTRGVENSARIVITKVENDDSTTVDNDELFKVPLVEVGSLVQLTYNV